MFGSPSAVGSWAKFIRPSSVLGPSTQLSAPGSFPDSSSNTSASDSDSTPTHASLVPRPWSLRRQLTAPYRAPPPPPQMLSRKHVQQAMRLADDALTEQEKGSSSDHAYALDCYLASLEYLLSAVPSDLPADCFPGAGDRQTIIHAKLSQLLRRAEDANVQPNIAADDDLDATAIYQPGGRWWTPQRLWRHAAQQMASEDQGDGRSEVAAASALAADCRCGRRVLVSLPGWVPEGAAFEAAPMGWPETLVSMVLSVMVMVRDSPVPYWLTLAVTSLFSMALYIEARFRLLERLSGALAGLVAWLWAANQEFGLHKVLIDWASWAVSVLLRAAVALANTPSPAHPPRRRLPPAHPARQNIQARAHSSTAAPPSAAPLRRSQSVRMPPGPRFQARFQPVSPPYHRSNSLASSMR